MENLKQKTVSGIMWSAIERFSLQGVQFIIQIILARLLLPSDYGMIGMLAIFLQVAQVFIDSGFTNALIQKKDRTEEDFATVFYFNILVAVLFYGILFFSASLIADFYNMPTLVLVIRFIALSLIINALSAIHRTKLIISVNFKTQSKISLGAAFISGVIGIWMAYVGCGVWALVWQTLLNSIILTILFYCLVHWKPLHTFSKSSFERLFNFGSKLLISSLINTVYRNLYTIVIGKKFSVVELGYYTRAEQFAIFPSNNLNALVSRIVEYRLATPEKFYASMNLLFNYISDSHVFIKAHPYQASSVVNTLVGLLEQHGKTWTLIPNDEPFEQILLSVENLCVFGTESSLMFYATLLGNNNKIISNRNNLAFNDIIFRKYAQNSESLVVNSYIQI